MTYLRLLRFLAHVLRWAEARTGWWTFTDWRGHVAFHQIDYAKRVQEASGWQPVQVVNTRPAATNWIVSEPTTTLAAGSKVTMTWRSA